VDVRKQPGDSKFGEGTLDRACVAVGDTSLGQVFNWASTVCNSTKLSFNNSRVYTSSNGNHFRDGLAGTTRQNDNLDGRGRCKKSRWERYRALRRRGGKNPGRQRFLKNTAMERTEIRWTTMLEGEILDKL